MRILFLKFSPFAFSERDDGIGIGVNPVCPEKDFQNLAPVESPLQGSEQLVHLLFGQIRLSAVS